MLSPHLLLCKNQHRCIPSLGDTGDTVHHILKEIIISNCSRSVIFKIMQIIEGISDMHQIINRLGVFTLPTAQEYESKQTLK